MQPMDALREPSKPNSSKFKQLELPKLSKR